jgi:predicted acetylornithine/succinylornithine family transaminase
MSTIAAPPLLPVYARQDVTFVAGEDCWLVDEDGRRYLDLVAGIAVAGLGHLHPAPLAAAHAQLDQLWHASNLYSTQPAEELAARLSERFGGARAFFCNSGTEAVEAALKHARKSTGKPGIVAMRGSFHGRTLGALSATGQPAKQAPFEPLVPGVRFAEPGDTASLAAAVDGEVGCILLEPVLGEGGVRPLSPEFVAAARALADDAGALLVLDEVQTGVGRAGTFFCFEQLGVRPDAVTLAKGLANGLPIGALLVADGSPPGLESGDHGSTFGGNPVACASAVATVDAITDQLLAAIRGKEAFVRSIFPGVRGRGLLLGLELDDQAAPVVDACRERGVLVGSAGERVLRLTPPLTIPMHELAHGLHVLEEVLDGQV